MPNRKQIIIFSVLGLTALLIGYFKNPLNLSMGKRAEVQGPVPPTIVVTNTAPVKPKPNPVKPRTISPKDVVGTYERISDADIRRLVFLANGTMEYYVNGNKISDFKWTIWAKKEIYIKYDSGQIGVYRINTDNSITRIATISNSGRSDLPKEKQFTLKKINQPTRTLTLEEKDIVGTYEMKSGANTFRLVFQDNFKSEHYVNRQTPSIGNWSIVGIEIHIVHQIVNATIYRMNPDNSITWIADIRDGKRTDRAEEKQYTYKKINQPQPIRTLTLEEKKVVGTYEWMTGTNTWRYVYLDNGINETYYNGKKKIVDRKWSIVDKEIHVVNKSGYATVHRINPDNSISYIASIRNGKRTDESKEEQTWIKIK